MIWVVAVFALAFICIAAIFGYDAGVREGYKARRHDERIEQLDRMRSRRPLP